MERLRDAASKSALLCLVLGLLVGCTNSYSYEPVYEMNGERHSFVADDIYRRGITHLGANRIGLALHDLRRALATNPTSVPILNAIAISYDELGRYDASRRYYERSLALEPDSVQTLNNLARSLLRQGRPQEALSYLNQARNLAEANQIVQGNLQAAHQQLTEQSASMDAIAGRLAPDLAGSLSIRPAWVERTSQVAQTLVTSPQPGLVKTAMRGGIKPSDVGFHELDLPAAAVPAADVELRAPISEAPPEMGWAKAVKVVAQLAAADARSLDIDAPATGSPTVLAAYNEQAAPSDGNVIDAGTVVRAMPAPSRLTDGITIEPVESEPLAPLDFSDRRQQVATRSGADDLTPLAGAEVNMSEGLFTLEVSNGAGRRHMAARMGRYLEARGLPMAKLTNASSFTHQDSTLFYRPGLKAAAVQVAATLPVPIRLQEHPGQRHDLRLLLGGDLLEFDGTTLLASKGF